MVRESTGGDVNEQEQERWSGVCVVLTAILLTQHAILTGDMAAAQECHKQGLAAAKEWQRRLQADMPKNSPERT